MGQKLPPQDMELYRRVDEVLHYLWDPVGISEFPMARDEYYDYSARVFSFLKITTDGKEIEEYLLMVEKDFMGMDINLSTKQRAKEIVEILVSYKKITEEQAKR